MVSLIRTMSSKYTVFLGLPLGTIREDDNEGKEAPENKENEENINNNSMEKDLTNENKSLKDMIEDEDAINEKNVNNSQ